MMVKLIRYEMKCITRILLPVYLGYFILVFVSGVLNRLLSYNEKLTFIVALINMLVYMITIAFVAVTMFVPIIKYYSSMVKNESYQTFSIPVDIKSLLFSKLIIAVINNLISFLLVIISMYFTNSENFSILSVRESKVYISEEPVNINIFILIILIFIFLIITYALYNLLVFTAISVGQLYSRNIIAGTFGVGILLYICFMILLVPTSILFMKINNNIDGGNIFLFAGAAIAIILLINLAFFNISNYLLKEKLNIN